MDQVALNPQNVPPGRWRSADTLAVRIAVVINLAAFGVLGSFWWVDYERTRSSLLNAAFRKLREEAKVLVMAKEHMPDRDDFQRFVDHFCEQMDAAASPGHHIAVFDDTGAVVVRAHVHNDPVLESELGHHRRIPSALFTLGDAEYLATSIPCHNGWTVVVSQSLDTVQGLLHEQAVSRAWSIGSLALAILGVSGGIVYIWVHRPLRRLVRVMRQIRDGNFSARVPPGGSHELRMLAHGMNELTAALERVDRERRQQMKRAGEIQRYLLPALTRHHSDYDIDAAFLPAESVGGDFYDVLELSDGSTLVVLLDVCGHGVPAALHTALLRTVLHYEAQRSSDPARLAEAMNEQFLSITSNGEFASGLLLRLTPGGSIAFVTAGHDPAVLLRPDGSIGSLDAGGPVLGVIPGQRYQLGSTTMRPGDAVFLFTDGLYEFPRPDGTLWGRERWLAWLLSLPPEVRAGDLHDVVERLRRLAPSQGFDDDVTLLRISRTNSPRSAKQLPPSGIQ